MLTVGGQQKNPIYKRYLCDRGWRTTEKSATKREHTATALSAPFLKYWGCMKKEEAIRIICSCAKNYQTNLENRNLLFLFAGDSSVQSFETVFLPRHFLHLTGAKVEGMSSVHFYNLCIDNKLSYDTFSFAPDGTTVMKLDVLPQLTCIHTTAKMVGDYNNSKSNLYTKKLSGSVTACLGFAIDESGYYVPNTALKEDIRGLTTKAHRILAIYSKYTDDDKYQAVSYLAKGIKLSELVLPQNVATKINK